MRQDPLGDRCKGYEGITQYHLTKRTPIIVRIDGRAFHTLTRGLRKPFDPGLNQCFVHMCMILVDQLQGCKLAYSQSDEISLLLTDWDTYETEQWFGGNLQKIVSVGASIATQAFAACQYKGGATFDARAFQLPREDVTNYFLWRQRDAERNSVSALAHVVLGHKACQGVSTKDLITALESRDVRWNELPTVQKRGFCVIRQSTGDRQPIHVDTEIPRFGDDRTYINRLLEVPDGP